MEKLYNAYKLKKAAKKLVRQQGTVNYKEEKNRDSNFVGNVLKMGE